MSPTIFSWEYLYRYLLYYLASSLFFILRRFLGNIQVSSLMKTIFYFETTVNIFISSPIKLKKILLSEVPWCFGSNDFIGFLK